MPVRRLGALNDPRQPERVPGVPVVSGALDYTATVWTGDNGSAARVGVEFTARRRPVSTAVILISSVPGLKSVFARSRFAGDQKP